MCGCTQFPDRILFRKHPPVVLIAGNTVRHIHRIPQHNILPKAARDDSPIHPAKRFPAAQHRQRSVLNLLQNIVFPVRVMDFYSLCTLIDRCAVPFHMKSLIDQCKDIRLSGLGLDPQIEISGVMPSSSVQSWHRIPGPEAG